MLQQQRGNGNEEGNPNGNVRTTVCVCVEGRMFAFSVLNMINWNVRRSGRTTRGSYFVRRSFFFRQVCCYFAIGLACYKSIDWRRVFEWLPWLDGRYPGSLVNWIPWQVKMEATAKVKSRRIRPKSWTWGDTIWTYCLVVCAPSTPRIESTGDALHPALRSAFWLHTALHDEIKKM